jgi:hypothetical protein
MSSQEQLPGKVCVVCGVDRSGRPRVKDPRGRYYCRDCYERLSRRQKKHHEAKPAAVPPPPEEPQEPELIPADEDGDLGLFGELSSAEGGAAVANVQQIPCPGCRHPMSADAILCMRCGYDRQHGTRMAAAEATQTGSGGGFSFGALGGAGAILKQPWLAGAVPAVFFLILFAMARGNKDVALIYLAAQGIFSLVVAVLVLVKAFCQSVGTGFLCLCVPCYVLYFVYSDQNDNVLLKWAYGAMLLASGLSYALGGVVD